MTYSLQTLFMAIVLFLFGLFTFSLVGCKNQLKETIKFEIHELNVGNNNSGDIAANFISQIKEYEIYDDTVLTTIYYLNERGLEDSVKHWVPGIKYIKNEPTPHFILQVFEYNQNKELKSVLSRVPNSNSLNSNWVNYTSKYYNFNGYLILIERFNYKSELIEAIHYRYDEQKNLIYEEDQQYSGKYKMRNIKYEYSYDLSSNLIKKIYFDRFEFKSSTNINYFNEDRLVVKMKVDSNNQLIYDSYSYYNNEGYIKQLLENYYNQEEIQPFRSDTTIFYFNTHGLCDSVLYNNKVQRPLKGKFYIYH